MKDIFLEAPGKHGIEKENIKSALQDFFGSFEKLDKLLLLPPDITRNNSYAGPILTIIQEILPHAQLDILPALGTHVAMTDEEIDKMYPGMPKEHFIEHNWRNDVVHIGDVPKEFIAEVSEGRINEPIAIEINRRLLDPSYDLILSVGQVVPHEVVGMSNYIKNILVGCGGSACINGSHFLGAIFGMERMMGRDNSPVHKVFDYAEEHFLAKLPLAYILTVTTVQKEGPRLHSFAVGRNRQLFSKSILVSQKHNMTFLDAPLKKVVVYLDPEEFRTTWIGNKSVYRTRMAMADGGDLIVIAPGVHRFGEDMQNDVLIRKYGYCGRDRILQLVQENQDLAENLSVAAHLIHGSSDGRFNITYAPGHLTKDEVESAYFSYMPLEEALQQYNPSSLKDGFNTVNGEEIFFVSNPAVGLWAYKERFYQ